MAASTRSIHSRQRAAAGKSASSTSRTFFASTSAAARRGGHRPYSRNAGRPGELADGAERDQPIEQATRGAIGHRRLARGVGGRDAILGEQQVDDFRRRLGTQFGRCGEQDLRAEGQVGGRSSAEAAAQRDRRRRRCSTRRARPVLVAARRRAVAGRGPEVWSRLAVAGRGQRNRIARTRSNAQRAKISASAAGASGKSGEGERRRPGRRLRKDPPFPGRGPADPW